MQLEQKTIQMQGNHWGSHDRTQLHGPKNNFECFSPILSFTVTQYNSIKNPLFYSQNMLT